MTKDICRVGIEYVYREIGKQPGVGSQCASLHVLHVLGFISYAAVRVDENCIVRFDALHRGHISLFDDPGPIILNAHQFCLN